MKRILLLSFMAVLLFTACKRTTIIPDDELALIFRDAFLTNAYLENKHIKEDSLNLYAPLFDRYGYSTEDVQLTIGNFSKRKSARLGDVVEQAIKLLEEEGLRYDHQVMILDTIRDVAIRRSKQVVYQDSLIRVQSLKDTTLLEIAIPAEIGEYEIDFYCNVDSLDKNKRLQRRMWVQRKNGSIASLQYHTLSRTREEHVVRTIKTDSLSDTLRLKLIAFPESPKRPRVTVRDLKITFTPTERQAIEELYHEQLNLRIFAEEFIHALHAKDSIQ